MEIKNCSGELLKEVDGDTLRGANLRDVHLYGADLRDANLRDANLYGADLRDADLRDADLRDANLRDANLRGANLYGAKIAADLILAGERPWFSVGPIGSRADYLFAYVTNAGLRLSAGCCALVTAEKLREKVAETHGDNTHGAEYAAAIDLCQKHFELWGPK